MLTSSRKFSFSFGKAAIGITLTCVLVSTARAQEFPDPRGPLWSSAGREVQLTGKVLCTGCTLEEARKTHPTIPATRLYVVQTSQGQIVTELHWISNPQWGDRLTIPHVVQLRADDRLVQQLLATANHSQELQATGVLSHMGTLYVHDVKLTACPTEASQDFASSALVSTCSAGFQPER